MSTCISLSLSPTFFYGIKLTMELGQKETSMNFSFQEIRNFWLFIIENLDEKLIPSSYLPTSFPSHQYVFLLGLFSYLLVFHQVKLNAINFSSNKYHAFLVACHHALTFIFDASNASDFLAPFLGSLHQLSYV